MKATKASTAEDFKLLTSFETVRRLLLDQKFADRLDKPLAYWALPNDRRLPLAFLGRTLGDLLATPFHELTATPGIGQKKIGSFVKLLERATQEQPPDTPLGRPAGEPIAHSGGNGHARQAHFEAALVSEAMWEKWKDTVRKHELAHEKLGRLAPTLQNLPTVIWHTPLGFYLDRTLSDIRSLKTHGEKRVRVVLEVFYVVHEMLGSSRVQAHLGVRLSPRFVPLAESWLARIMEAEPFPSLDDVKRQLTLPVLEQVELDGGPVVHKLAEGRLAIGGPRQSVRQQSRKMGVTRARVYQLLEECAKIMYVRWPEGRCAMSLVLENLTERNCPTDVIAAMKAVSELLFPDKDAEEEDEDD